MEIEELIANFKNGDIITWALFVVACLIVIVSIISSFVSIFLAIKYIKFNHRKSSIGMTGKEIARKILDDNGLSKIKVKCSGSILFGNSYSHYFKKVRLRRLTWKKKSISSLAMAAQKSSLAILDKEKDKDMKLRIKLVPLITFGPFAFIPLIVIGVIVDLLVFNNLGLISILAVILGISFYVLSFVLSLMTLKTEKKAQDKALKILKENDMATSSEIESIKELFHLYNIEYVNDMILAMLEMIYNILRIILILKGSSSSSSAKNK